MNESKALLLESRLRLLIPEGNFFGISDWKTHHPDWKLPSDIIMPDLSNVAEIVEAPNPFGFRLDQTKEQIFLFYLPEKVSLKKLETMYPTGLRVYTNQNVRCWYKDKKFVNETGDGKWHLLFKKPIPNSFDREFEEAKKMVPTGFHIPTVLPAIAMHLLHGKKNKEGLNPACLGLTSSFDGNMIIGVGRNHQGLLISKNDSEGDMGVGLFAGKKIKQRL